jgi:hypothetical protein
MFVGPHTRGSAPTKPAVLVRLTETDSLRLAEQAERDGNSLGGYVRTLVRRHLDDSAGSLAA